MDLERTVYLGKSSFLIGGCPIGGDHHYFSFLSDGIRLDGEYIVKDYSIFCVGEI